MLTLFSGTHLLQTRGHFGGLGMQLSQREGHLNTSLGVVVVPSAPSEPGSGVDVPIGIESVIIGAEGE